MPAPACQRCGVGDGGVWCRMWRQQGGGQQGAENAHQMPHAFSVPHQLVVLLCPQDQLADVPVYAHPKAVVRADGSVEALEIT